MRNYLALALLAVLVCYVTAAPRRPFRGPAMGRVPNPLDPMPSTHHERPHHRPHHGPHHRRPKPVICKFNSTRLDIDYDEPCDLPEYFECVEGKPARPGGSHGGPDLDRGALFGGRPEVNRDVAAERPRRHAEVGSCRQKNCTSDSECGEFFCVNGKCNITRDVRKYAAACNVTDESGTVIKERECLRGCGTRGSDIVYEGRNLIAYFCRAPHHRDSSEEEDYFDFRPFGDDSEEVDSEEWSSGDVDEDGFRPFGGQGGRPFDSEEDGDMDDEEHGESFPVRPPNFGGRPERPDFDGNQERPTSGGRPQHPDFDGNQERPTSGGNQERPTSGGNQERPTSGGRPQRPDFDGNQERPTSGDNQERPTSGGRPQRPDFGGNQERPSSGGNQERPASGGNQERPASGGRPQRPDISGNQERLTAGGNQGRPISGGNQERPTSGGRPQRPPTGGRPERPNFGGRRQ